MVFRLNTVEAGLVLSRLVFLVFALSASLLFAPLEAPPRGALGLLPSSKTGVFFGLRVQCRLELVVQP